MKSYLKFEKRISFGVLSSVTANVVISRNGEYACVGALENIILYNLNTKLPFLTLSQEDCDSVVTSLALAPDNIHIISGHENGTIRIWDYKKKNVWRYFMDINPLLQVYLVILWADVW